MNEEIIEKIQKLLRLGESQNEHEAALAVATANKLMEKYKICESMIDLNAEEKPAKDSKVRRWAEPIFKGGLNRSRWRVHLAATIAEVHSSKIFTSGANIHIVGTEHDRQAVQYLFAFCEKEIERLSKNPQFAGKGKSWFNNYKIGAINAIGDKLRSSKNQAREEIRKEYGPSGAVAIIKTDENDAMIARQVERVLRGMNLRTKSYGKQQSDQDAQYQGYRDGQKIKLNSEKVLPEGSPFLKKNIK